MALQIKCMAALTLGTVADASIYTPGAGKSALLRSIILVNKTGSPVTVHVKLKRSGGSFYLYPSGTQVPANGRVAIDDEITMSFVDANGDKLEAWAGTASAIDCVVSGAERDI